MHHNSPASAVGSRLQLRAVRPAFARKLCVAQQAVALVRELVELPVFGFDTQAREDLRRFLEQDTALGFSIDCDDPVHE